MKKWILWAGIVLIIFFVLASLGGDKNPPAPDNGGAMENYSYIPTINPVPRGDRLIGFDYTPGKDMSETQAFHIAKNAGMGAAQIYLHWMDIESEKEVYGRNGLEEKLKAKNDLFSQNNMKVILSVNEIAETGNKFPSDLQGKALDDPEVIERYKKVIDYVFEQLPNAEIDVISLGNEVDSHLGGDDEKWEEYTNFVNQASEYIKSKKPNVKVGVKSTFAGYTEKHVSELQKLSENLDVMLVTYYPMTLTITFNFNMKDPSVVRSDFDKITSLYPNKEIYFVEAGYASSKDCEGSEEKQAEFIKQIFIAWDEHSDQVKIINFLWLHDLSQDTVDYLAEAYGLSSKSFTEYLRTLGLRTYEGEDKPAFNALKQEAKIRGWNVI